MVLYLDDEKEEYEENDLRKFVMQWNMKRRASV